VVPPGDPEALTSVLREVLTADEPALRTRQLGARELLRAFTWDRALAPLLRFCRDPRTDPTKERFAWRPSTIAPPDPLPFRLKRWLRLWRLAR
jgi:hypothetical protein